MFSSFAPNSAFLRSVDHITTATDALPGILRQALIAICSGQWDKAEEILAAANAPRDPRILNLLGIVHQGRRQWKHARRFFGKAMKANYAPAEQNLRRIYELHTFGNTALPLAFGDWCATPDELTFSSSQTDEDSIDLVEVHPLPRSALLTASPPPRASNSHR